MDQTRQYFRLLPYLPVTLIPAVLLVVGPLIVIVSSPPVFGEPVLIISPWGQTADQKITNAGGQALGPIQARFGQFAASNDPDFPVRLKALGAWAVLDGSKLAAFCRSPAP